MGSVCCPAPNVRWQPVYLVADDDGEVVVGLGDMHYYYDISGIHEVPGSEVDSRGFRAGLAHSDTSLSSINSLQPLPDGRVIIPVGFSKKTSTDLYTTLSSYFPAGAYRTTGKNSNMFADCALAFLTSKRIPRRYINWNMEEENVEAIIMKVDELAWMGQPVRAD
eukprot:GEMP01084934.1.p1 GENE.GEMP01084934.1~~GEMP01084934.1.p1  ORF type:complete len:165 (+),score=21.21 GEMP01084934.1:134-628(+)